MAQSGGAGIDLPDGLRLTLAQAAARLSPAQPFDVVFDRGDDVSIELYAPIGHDPQTPHDRDELYIIATGTGTFSRAGTLVPFGPGDLLFVPAHVEHLFESFTADFSTWVIFYGRPRPKPL